MKSEYLPDRFLEFLFYVVTGHYEVNLNGLTPRCFADIFSTISNQNLIKIFKLPIFYGKEQKATRFKNFDHAANVILCNSIDLETGYFNINFISSKINELKKFIEKYIIKFRNDELYSTQDDYLDFNKHSELLRSFKYKYDLYGNTFNFQKSDINRIYDRPARFYELMLYLYINGFISINSCEYKKGNFMGFNKPIPTVHFTFNLTLNRTIAEIQQIHNYWTFYSGIRVNEDDGVAIYRNHQKYPAKSANGNAFRLLCYLVKNPAQKIPMEKAYDVICPNEEISVSTKKQRIKNYLQEIRKNLKIDKDKNPSVTIHTVGGNVHLVSNP